ncbi:MAG: glycosyltransferase [Gammaproteobacteria bacterium]|nr:glycosyltransferase [Gammaproteobacteria bacterium]MDP2140469.1 glycosyltransferase [Gammaproteobacteria bacterium]MDP2349508.1 glycosyltransferase [Gammaproteobacteria bacterium]
MNIVLATNTFTSHVGGVARSVEAFTEEYRRRGHRVLVVAPEFPDIPADEVDVLRVPAIQNFNASDFSVALPVPTGLSDRLQEFEVDIIHSQHPFLLGMTAVRMARAFQVPLVFTHHTLYEQYTHYVPGNSDLMRRFIIELGTRYANLCDQVFAPSESVRDLILARGVTAPVLVVPTGVRVEKFARGDGAAARRRLQIPRDVFVVGHMGRLAQEKNLEFLATAVSGFLQTHPGSVFLLVGVGPFEADIRSLCIRLGVADRLIVAGILQGEYLADALSAMDVFAFASMSETQGMVLTEAMAAGAPVVALDASGVREVVKDKHNGRLLYDATEEEFAAALAWIYQCSPERKQQLVAGAQATAEQFSLEKSAEKALACYERLQSESPDRWSSTEQGWEQVMRFIAAEWEVLRTLTQAGDQALTGGQNEANGNE